MLRCFVAFTLLTALAVPGQALAGRTVLTDLSAEPGAMHLKFSGPAPQPHIFTQKNPNRLVVDLPEVVTSRPLPAKSLAGGFSRVRIGRHPDKLRLVLDAPGALPAWGPKAQGNTLALIWSLAPGKTAETPEPAQAAPAQPPTPPPAAPAASAPRVTPAAEPVHVLAVDFSAEGTRSVVTVRLSATAEVLPAVRTGDIVRFGVNNATISRALRQSLDTTGFPGSVRMVKPYLTMRDGTEQVYFAVTLPEATPYQLKADGPLLRFSAEGLLQEAPSAPAPLPSPLRPSAALEAPKRKAAKPITLALDNADVRHVLRLISEVSKLSIVSSDDVKGTVNLRLIDVPWDQALETVLRVTGLGMRRNGQIVEVMPIDKLAAAHSDSSAPAEALAPLVTKPLPVDHAPLKMVSSAVKSALTPRGRLMEDERSKKLIITDTEEKLAEIRELVRLLDTPTRQVEIEARIVEADTSFSRNLGVNWSFLHTNTTPGSWESATAAGASGGGSFNMAPGLSAAGVAGKMTFGRLGIDSNILDVQLAALETEGRGKIISRPKVTALSGETATISQGNKIPYQTVGDSGTKTEFVDATLSLKVTPVINSDGTVLLEITATNSSPGSTVSTGAGQAPAIDTKEATTKVLVLDGETTVIGGVFIENNDNAEVGIPLLRHIPYLGQLFRSNTGTKSRSEMLVFVTPRIDASPER